MASGHVLPAPLSGHLVNTAVLCKDSANLVVVSCRVRLWPCVGS